MVFRAVSSVQLSQYSQCLVLSHVHPPLPKVNQLFLGTFHRRRFERPDPAERFSHNQSCVLSDYLAMVCAKGPRYARVFCHA